MAGPIEFFTQDHRECDALWAAFEAAVEGGSGEEAAFARFDRALRRHLRMEEEVLFPALEAATGMQGGPTFVMRAEHEQMRGVLDAMQDLARQADFEGVLDHGDTLLMLTQQHNMKEEGVLYPLAERALGGSWAELATRLSSYALD
ncbi:MAG: hemerythrin domain-containing protein [Polyangiaceae bacterium]